MRRTKPLFILISAIFVVAGLSYGEEAAQTQEKTRVEIDQKVIDNKSPSYKMSLKEIIREAEANLKKVDEQLKNQENEKAVKESFEKGNALYQEGKIEEASKEWQKAVDIAKDPSMKQYIRDNERRVMEVEREKERAERKAEEEKKETDRKVKLEAEQKQRELEKQQKEAERKADLEKREAERQARLEAEQKQRELEKQQKEAERNKSEAERKAELEKREAERQARLEAEQKQRELEKQQREAERNKSEAERKADLEKREAERQARLEAEQKQRELEKQQREAERQTKEEAAKAAANRTVEEAPAAPAESAMPAQAVTTVTENVSNLYREAVSLYWDNKYKDARNKFDEVQKMSPDYARTGYYLNRIKEKTGDVK